jgi:hypothetical protein
MVTALLLQLSPDTITTSLTSALCKTILTASLQSDSCAQEIVRTRKPIPRTRIQASASRDVICRAPSSEYTESTLAPVSAILSAAIERGRTKARSGLACVAW